MSADGTREGRLPYEPPVLLRFGTLTNLTTGGSGSMSESKGNKDPKKKP